MPLANPTGQSPEKIFLSRELYKHLSNRKHDVARYPTLEGA